MSLTREAGIEVTQSWQIKLMKDIQMLGPISGCLSLTREAGIEVTQRWQIKLMKDIQMFRNQLTDVLGSERSSDVF